MVSEVADVVVMWKLDVKCHSEVALIVVLLIRVVIAVPVVADVRPSSYPAWRVESIRV